MRTTYVTVLAALPQLRAITGPVLLRDLKTALGYGQDNVSLRKRPSASARENCCAVFACIARFRVPD